MIKNQGLKIIFIPGNGGGGEDILAPDGWWPYVKAKLEELGLEVIARNYPDPDLVRREYWLPFLKNELRANETTILIGHSSGAEAAMRFAEENKIHGSVLISACHSDLGMESEKASGYYDTPWQWEKIKNNQNWIIQFHSTDDPFIPVKEAREIHQLLETEYYEFTDQGHFGGPIEKTEFPELIEALKKKLNTYSSNDYIKHNDK